MPNPITLGDPSLNLQITKQHATVVVEPTSQMGGKYDTAIISTVFVINNPGEARDVEFIVPYETESFSASVAVISAGAEAYRKRIDSLSKITGNLERIKPYLSKMQLPADQYDTKKELRSHCKTVPRWHYQYPDRTVVNPGTTVGDCRATRCKRR